MRNAPSLVILPLDTPLKCTGEYHSGSAKSGSAWLTSLLLAVCQQGRAVPLVVLELLCRGLVPSGCSAAAFWRGAARGGLASRLLDRSY